MKYKVLEATQSVKTEKGFYWKVKVLGEDGKTYEGSVWKATEPAKDDEFMGDLVETAYGWTFKNPKWLGKQSKSDRDKYDFTKEEKIENDKKTAERILRQGFMNIICGMLKPPKDLEEWQELAKQIEPIYRKYVEEGRLDFSSLKEDK